MRSLSRCLIQREGGSSGVGRQGTHRLAYAAAALAGLTLWLATPLALAQQTGKAADTGSKLVLRGAGATFPAPLYKKWISEYTKAHPEVAIDYRDVGSGEGQKRFVDEAVDFGASDAALSDEQIAKVKPGAALIPATAGMVVLAYNLPGLNGPLKLSRTTYVDLLAGRIPKWNDARIQAINPELKLPNKNIVVVGRQDSSGTTFALTNHLAAISGKWNEMGRGVGNIVAWGGGAMLARGNEGVAARIKVSEGAIGYVEYGFAKRLNLPMAQLENKNGHYVAPNAASGQAAIAANLKRIPANLRAYLPDPEGDNAYPIVSLTWLLLYERYGDANKGAALKRFVNWALADGQSLGGDLGYIPLPADLIERSKAAAEAIR